MIVYSPSMLRLTLIFTIVNNMVIYSNSAVFTADRLYGMRPLPKRPWEAFKNPEETMKRVAYKHNRPDIRY